MQFLSTAPGGTPQKILPCQITLTLGPSSTEDEINPLQRVLSGGNRRRTSFGPVADRGEDRRKSFTSSFGPLGDRGEDKRKTGTSFGPLGDRGEDRGKVNDGRKNLEGRKSFDAGKEKGGVWYWRVKAGVSGNQVLILTLDNPPNPLLTSPPAPLSTAIPSKSTANESEPSAGGISGAFKNLFNRTSTQNSSRPEPDQREQIESSWPGVVNGDKLGAIVVDLRGVLAGKVMVGGGGKGEGNWVMMPVNAPMGIGHVGENHLESAKSGSIKFEFDKEWIGGKGEAELLHHYIISGIESLSNNTASGADRQISQATTYQLGQHQSKSSGSSTLVDGQGRADFGLEPEVEVGPRE